MATKNVNINLESLFVGEEPEWGTEKELTIPRALSWYSNQKDWKDSKKYTIDYAKSLKLDKQLIEKLSDSNEDLFKNLGFVCRMIQRGAELNKEEWIEKRIAEIVSYDQKITNVSQFAQQPKSEKSIQDRIYDVCSALISDIEDFVDLFVKTKEKVDFIPYDWMCANSVKSVHAKQIKEHFIPLQKELSAVIEKSDDDLVEGYSNFSKKQIKEYYSLVSLIVDDCDKISTNTKTVRKTRKKKVVSLDKKVSKVQYKKEDVEHKLVSVSPTEILGAKQVWVFNTKYKTLGCYISEDDSGFGIKGTTILGFDSTNSIQKKLRKPLEVLDEFKKLKKTEYKKFLPKLSTKESSLNGRINNDTIILKVIK